MNNWTPADIIALIVALPALILALRGQGKHDVNAANITAVKDTANAALSQSAQALALSAPAQIAETSSAPLPAPNTVPLAGTSPPVAPPDLPLTADDAQSVIRPGGGAE